MVGPGTGIAPFRAFVQERSQADNYLVFGCRNEQKDFYYREEWKTFQNLKLFTAFSRDGEDKKYVQHVIRENKDLFADLILNKDARIYICGRAKNMPKYVQKAFTECLETKVSKKEAEDIIEEMQKRKKTYCLDVW